MKQEMIETIVGLLIILVTGFFLAYAIRTGGSNNSVNGYTLNAQFQNIDGIVEGSDVMLAGINIGLVEKMSLDQSNFSALLTLKIKKEVKLPSDSLASVNTSGFLGNKFIAITPGGADDDLKEGGRIKYTQSSINIEALIGKLMYSVENLKSTTTPPAASGSK